MMLSSRGSIFSCKAGSPFLCCLDTGAGSDPGIGQGVRYESDAEGSVLGLEPVLLRVGDSPPRASSGQ